MMRSLFSAVSGLKTHQQRMDVIGNNIANVNTPGYKKSRVTFQDMLNQTIRGASRPVEGGRGGTNPMQMGLGVTIGSIDTDFGVTSLQDTGKNTDLGINGDGFFVLGESGGRLYYTRAGNFDFDRDGNLVSLLNGMHVQGWLPDASGSINPLDDIQNIKIDLKQSAPAKATSKIVFGGNIDFQTNNGILTFNDGSTTKDFTITHSGVTSNLQISFSPSSAFNTWEWTIVDKTNGSQLATGKITMDSTTGNVSICTGNNTTFKLGNDDIDITLPVTGDNAGNFTFSGTNVTGVNGLPDPTMKFNPPGYNLVQTVYDSLGNQYTTVINFTKDSSNNWTWSLKSVSDSNNNPITPVTGNGTFLFDASTGRLAAGSNSSGNISFIPSGATAPLNINLDFSNLTQFASETTAGIQEQDGYQSGNLERYSIDQTGTIVGVFSNGVTRNLAQIALARFTNPGGLTKEGNSLYSESSNSGDSDIKPPGSSGFGTVKPGTLEMSNVDLSSEFTDMITTQRGFQANSRVITASDEMLQDLVNLKR